MIVKAYAKINLGLKIVSKTEEGYHNLDMLMMPISLHDTLEIEVLDEDKIIVEEKNGKFFPVENSIVQVIKIMKEKYQIEKGFKVVIDKIIPTQAGMGGGTSDAASTIKAVNELMNLNLSLEEMEEIGNKVGSDVAFSLHNCLCRVQGKGELIEEVNKKFNYPILIVKPKKGIKTKDCFSLYNIDEDDIPNRVIDDLIYNLNKELYVVRRYSKNSLLKPARKIAPIIHKIFKQLREFDVNLVQMSGSGSTVFAIDKDVNKLLNAYEKMKDDYGFVGLYETMSEIK